MKSTKWKCSLALSLGLFASHARGEGEWISPSAPPALANSATALGQPIARAGGTSTETPSAPAASLGRPLAAATTAAAEPGSIRPASFIASANPEPFYRGAAPEPLPTQPTPVGKGTELISAPKGIDSPPLATGPIVPVPAPGPCAIDPCLHANPCLPANLCDCPCGAHMGWFDGCGACCHPGNRLYVSAEYLLWGVKGSPLPALATTSTINNFNFNSGPPFNGALGTQGTSVLIGDNNAGTGARSGLRGTVGYWFTDDHCIGLEVGGFFLGDKNNNYVAQSFGNQLIGRPFADSSIGVQNVEATAGHVTFAPRQDGMGNTITFSPTTLGGSVNVQHTSSFYGWEANLRTTAFCGPRYYVDFLLGYRGLALDESLSINESLMFLNDVTFAVNGVPGGVVFPQGSTFFLGDRFSTQNRFYGVQIGTNMEFKLGKSPWTLGLTGKVGLGDTQEVVNIMGGTVQNVPPGPSAAFPGGLLAQPSNIGRYTRDQFSVVPEFGMTIGYNCNEHWKIFAGYNFLYWSNVVRPGNQVDPTVDGRFLAKGMTPPADAIHPAFSWHSSDFWAQGFTVGLEFRY
jgi:hypothetical protein